jgi:hypothetical protein
LNTSTQNAKIQSVTTKSGIGKLPSIKGAMSPLDKLEKKIS